MTPSQVVTFPVRSLRADTLINAEAASEQLIFLVRLIINSWWSYTFDVLAVIFQAISTLRSLLITYLLSPQSHTTTVTHHSHTTVMGTLI